jgi:ribosome-associated protein
LDIRKKQKAVVTALEDIKAHDITVFDVTHITALFDRVVIASADSARQTKALAQHVEDTMRGMGSRVVGREGDETGDWILVDFGDIVVHIMQPAVRAHYNLEELWDQPKPRARRPRTAAAAQPAV